ncbi:GtrA family protein [Sphingomonas sp. HITSZ_GF]|uniref:GtrA family protein n=1 Tax=Sphingomonas sp. HITSZ_GF TaxID=3037247 RepID=UPI00240DDB35|nr:GtrA family protein [Sphingomonas sp. HITSZ_GF]MDG2535762.1 GtrA family protein [Sphingomonas sp. HITSZ_GF]
MSTDKLHAQFIRFVAVGVMSTVFDGIAYRIALTALPVGGSKAIGYLVGTSFSILCNYRWNFGYAGPDRAGVILRCVALYATALVLNVAVNQAALAVLPASAFSFTLAFLIAVGVCTIYNFAGMRFWIFAGTVKARQQAQ